MIDALAGGIGGKATCSCTTLAAPQLRRTIADADDKINRYRATLDAGGDPALSAAWITETTSIKKAAQARLGLTEAAPQRMTGDQLDAIAEAFADLLGLLRDADRHDKAELYSRIGLRLTYRPGPETMIAEVVIPANRVFDMCPEIDTNQCPTGGRSVHDHFTAIASASRHMVDCMAAIVDPEPVNPAGYGTRSHHRRCARRRQPRLTSTGSQGRSIRLRHLEG